MARPLEVNAGSTRVGFDVQTLIAGAGAPGQGEPADLGAGDRVGRYRIEGKLGAGGMGTVYLAHDPDLDRRVAIKMLHTRVGGGDPSTGSQRLLREAQAMARLAHANVVTVHDVGVLGGSLFIAMELIDGQDLRQWLAECPRSWREIVLAFIEAGQGLLAAHEAGIVHRDFKPENVMVAANGRICVGDFGLAAASSAPQVAAQGALSTSCLSSAGTLTAAGAVMGTPAYMAPEQMVGGEITAAADIFAFCVALYEALYDQRPFKGDSVAELYLEIAGGALQPPPRSTVPRRLEVLLRRGLQGQPENRPPSMEAVLAELRPLVASRSKLWISAVAIAVLGVLTATIVSVLEEPVSCTGGAAEVAEIWSAERQGALREAFESTGSVHAVGTWERAEAGIQSAAGAWAHARRQACEETHHSAEFSEEILALRVACLGRQLGEMDRLLSFFGEADKKIVDNAIALVRDLPDPRRCDPAEVLAAAAKGSPHSPKLDALEVELGDGRRFHRAGRYGEAIERYDHVLAGLEGLGAPALEARALAERAHSTYVDDRSDAEEWLRRALEATLRVGDDIAFARVVADKLGAVDGDPEQQLLWYGIGDAAVARSGERSPESESVLAKLKTNYGNALRRAARLEESLVVHEEVLRLRRHVDESSYLVGDAYYNLAASTAALERYDQANSFVSDALAIWERELGPQHPRVLRGLQSLVIIRQHSGDTRGALEGATRVLALSRELMGEKHQRTLRARIVLGNAFEHCGDRQSALQHYEAALVFDSGDTRRARGRRSDLYLLIGSVALDLGDLKRAEEVLALAEAERVHEDGFSIAYPAALAKLAWRRGELDQAEAHLQRGLQELFAGEQVFGGYYATYAMHEARIALTRNRPGRGLSSLAALGSQYPETLRGDRRADFLWVRARLHSAAGLGSRARADAIAALEAFESCRCGEGFAPERTAIRRWLSEHEQAR